MFFNGLLPAVAGRLGLSAYTSRGASRVEHRCHWTRVNQFL